MSDHQPALSIEAVSHRFGERKALERVSLTVPAGSFTALLGLNGAGKTTLLMMIAGFVPPSEGDIFLGSRRITGLLPERRNFGMVFQGYALFPHLTVAENVAFPLRARRMGRAEIEARVQQVLALVQLEALAGRLPRQLSGGQQQRVALARAIVFSPDLLLLDEPLSALDKRLRSDLQGELTQLHRQVGRTFINVTHDQEEALAMSSRVAIMREGRVVQIGTPNELYERPATRFVADFLGKSNFLRTSVDARAGSAVRYRLGGRSFVQADPSGRMAAGAPLLVALRPEKIALFGAPPADTAESVLAGDVLSASYTGSSFHLLVGTAEAGELMVTAPTWRADVSPQVGSRVWLAWPAHAGIIIDDD